METTEEKTDEIQELLEQLEPSALIHWRDQVNEELYKNPALETIMLRDRIDDFIKTGVMP